MLPTIGYNKRMRKFNRRMAGEPIGYFPVPFIDPAAQGIDQKQMRRAARRFVKRHRRIANFFQRARQAARIARVLGRRGIGQIFALARHGHRQEPRDQR